MNLIELISKKSSPDFEPGITTFLNPYSYLVASKSLDIYQQFDRIYCDGILLVKFLRLVGLKVERRSFDMTSLAPLVFEQAIARKLSICLVGGEAGVAEKAKGQFIKTYPGLNICSAYSGFFSSEEHRSSLITNICSDSPDIVIVGMGAGIQERFILDLVTSGWSGYGFTCGGFFHQTVKRGVRYYPEILNRYNLRWIYRIYDEPALFRRYVLDYPKFVLRFLNDALRFLK